MKWTTVVGCCILIALTPHAQAQECPCKSEIEELEAHVREIRGETPQESASADDLQVVKTHLAQLLGEMRDVNNRLGALQEDMTDLRQKVEAVETVLGKPVEDGRPLLARVDELQSQWGVTDGRVERIETQTQGVSDGLVAAQGTLDGLVQAVGVPASEDGTGRQLGQVVAGLNAATVQDGIVMREELKQVEASLEELTEMVGGVASGTDGIITGVQDIQTGISRLRCPGSAAVASRVESGAVFDKLEAKSGNEGVELIVESRLLEAASTREVELIISLVDESLRAPDAEEHPAIKRQLIPDTERRMKAQVDLPWEVLDRLRIPRDYFGLRVMLQDEAGAVLAEGLIQPVAPSATSG